MTESRFVGKIVGARPIVGNAACRKIGGGMRPDHGGAALGRLAHRDRRAGGERRERPEREESEPHRLPPKR